MFFYSPLLYLPNNISTWDTKNFKDIDHMFSNCNLLSSLPDISNWNTERVTNMSSIFSNCCSLISLIWMNFFNIVSHYVIYQIFQNGIQIM